MLENLRRVRYLFNPSEAWNQGYDKGYHKGLDEGHDFGERVAHNRTLALELPRILSRYSQLQIRIINKPVAEMKKELARFEQRELDRLKMEMQDR
jgi:hypothetical protein